MKAINYNRGLWYMDLTVAQWLIYFSTAAFRLCKYAALCLDTVWTVKESCHSTKDKSDMANITASTARTLSASETNDTT